MERGFTAYQTTCGAIAYHKMIRQVARFETHMLDLDLCGATAVLQDARHHGQYALLHKLATDRQYFESQLGVGKDVVKKLFYGIMNGGGKKHLQDAC